MPHCHIALGGNLGHVAETFDLALDRIAKCPGNSVIAVSSFRRTGAVGDQAGETYLNAAAEIETRLAPQDLLTLLQTVEQELGRTRTTRWGPRTIDLDIAFYGSEIINSPNLVIPHPAAWYRRFVLDPLVEIAPHLIHPEKQVALDALRARLLVRPLAAALVGGDAELRSGIARNLEAAFPEVAFVEYGATTSDAPPPAGEPTFTFWLGSAGPAPGTRGPEFLDLPLLSRLDVTAAVDPPAAFIRYVLQSALG